MKLTKQMIVTLIEEVMQEGLTTNPELSPERLLQLRIKNAQRDPENSGYMHFWMGMSNPDYNVEDMEGILTPEEYELYAAGWERGRSSQENFFSGPSTVSKGQLPYANTRTAGVNFKRLNRGPLRTESSEEFDEERYQAMKAKMKPVTGMTLQNYLDPFFSGGVYGTAIEADLSIPPTLRAAARASAIAEEEFPADQLLISLGNNKTAAKMVDIAKTAYDHALRTGKQ
jgi:hypothetical protein